MDTLAASVLTGERHSYVSSCEIPTESRIMMNARRRADARSSTRTRRVGAPLRKRDRADTSRGNERRMGRYVKARKGEADDFVPNDTSGLFANGIRIYSRSRSNPASARASERRIGDGDRWIEGGLASPGSTVRRLTSVRGFYYDVLESCGVR